MKIGVPKEVIAGENRVAMTPESAAALQKLGYECLIETGRRRGGRVLRRGLRGGGRDGGQDRRRRCGKRPTSSPRCASPTEAELKRLTKDKTLISFFNPGGNEEGLDARQGEGRQRHRDGNGAAHQPRPEDGRAVVDGQYRRLPRGDRGGQQFRPLLHRPGDGRRQGAARQGAGGRRRRGRSCRDRHHRQRSARSPTPSTCAPKWPSRSNRWAPSSSTSISRKNSRTARPPAAMPRCQSPEFRERPAGQVPRDWRRTWTSSSPPR